MSRAKPVRLVLCVDTLPDGPPEAPSPQPTQQPDAGLGALAERVALTLSGSEAIAPCGCRFHFFDGQPDLVMDARSRAAYVKEMRHTLRGKIAPHWHPCDVHRALQERVRAAEDRNEALLHLAQERGEALARALDAATEGRA